MLKKPYLDAIALIERLHRSFLEVVKLELDTQNLHDLNNIQALILFNIGDDEMTVGDLTLRGCYLGSNVSYNVKKLVEAGYIVQERSQHDRRSVHVRLTDKGLALCKKLMEMHDRHLALLAQAQNIKPEDLDSLITTGRRMERFWMRASDLVIRPGQVA